MTGARMHPRLLKAHDGARNQSLTVKQVMDMLADLPPDMPVIVWLPGSRLWLTGRKASIREGAAMIEANIAEGSVLDQAPL